MTHDPTCLETTLYHAHFHNVEPRFPHMALFGLLPQASHRFCYCVSRTSAYCEPRGSILSGGRSRIFECIIFYSTGRYADNAYTGGSLCNPGNVSCSCGYIMGLIPTNNYDVSVLTSLLYSPWRFLHPDRCDLLADD